VRDSSRREVEVRPGIGVAAACRVAAARAADGGWWAPATVAGLVVRLARWLAGGEEADGEEADGEVADGEEDTGTRTGETAEGTAGREAAALATASL
jgi:hypothetical protein